MNLQAVGADDGLHDGPEGVSEGVDWRRVVVKGIIANDCRGLSHGIHYDCEKCP